jgi:hypothetical protein
LRRFEKTRRRVIGPVTSVTGPFVDGLNDRPPASSDFHAYCGLFELFREKGIRVATSTIFAFVSPESK